MMSTNRDKTFINLERAAVKSIRIQHQLFYLKAAVHQKFQPRGIGDQMKFVCSIKDPYLQDLCDKIMYFAGSRILDTLILYYTKWSNDLKSTYYAEKTKIRKKLSDDDFCKVVRKVDDAMEKEKIKSVKTHHNKLIRDRERLRYRYTVLDNVENIDKN